MTYEMTGTITAVMEPQTFASGFCKREFVLDTGEKYNNEIKFECVKEKTALLDNVRTGDEVVVKFAVQGREYNGKYFVSLVAWGVHNHSDRVDSDDPVVDSGESADDLPYDTGATTPAQSSMPF
jgi:single-strand DNA-binding protein